ncbi:polysaccharide pyruvyl transferase family protein [Microbacterium sp. NE2HP2]|uniref:polysaccharide pyruvyl transferase family protein n=1 Tax=Microbacterium plantarum TaxID=1816425 RepID=UPI002365AE30|nr:polysaccharide pyruvyl transferase family protein [Microbacterium plantarum]MDD7945816.1 polysaccharide pyruvyl transferase family protein [Microbacterium plantarum]
MRVLAEGMRSLAMNAWGSETTVDFQDYGPGDSSQSFGTRAIARDILRSSGPIRSKLREYDVIIDSGAGDSFTDIYGAKRLVTMLYSQRLAFSEKIPIVMGPQTIGPFSNVVAKRLAGKHVRRMKVVLTRDSASADYAALLGRPEVIRTTDVVFALPREKMTKSRGVILNVSGLLWFSDSHLSATRYRNVVRQFAERTIADGYQLTLLAHVASPRSVVDDMAAIRELATTLPSEVEVVGPESLTQIRAVLGSGDVVVGARMHACLNALSMGTPAIPWAYSRKFAPLMADIGWAHGYDLRTDEMVVDSTLQDLRNVCSADWAANVRDVLSTADERLKVAIESLRSVVDET